MKNRFLALQPWLFKILNSIKREIKTDHLSKNPSFYRTYFGTRPINRLNSDEILTAYEKELLNGNEDLAEWIVNRWVFCHGEVYSHFAERLAKINPDFEQIQSLNELESEQILENASNLFGAFNVYVFSVLNGVVFPSSVLARLRSEAEKEEEKSAKESKEALEKETLEQTIARHQREVSRITEKYEGRIAGVMKKYSADVEALKKQIRALQKQAAAK